MVPSTTERYTYRPRLAVGERPDFCVYCGALATTHDHVVPRVLFRRAAKVGGQVVLPRSLVEDSNRPSTVSLKDWAVPACMRCNSRAGRRLDATLSARIARVKAGVL